MFAGLRESKVLIWGKAVNRTNEEGLKETWAQKVMCLLRLCSWHCIKLGVLDHARHLIIKQVADQNLKAVLGYTRSLRLALFYFFSKKS